jgi:gliding motility-associated-like protein
MYGDTLRYASGCDSLIRTVNLASSALIIKKDTAICDGDSYKLPWGTVVTVAGVYADTVRTASGCDSLVTSVKLSVNPKPLVKASKSNDVNCVIGTSTLNATGNYRYLWSPSASLSDAGIRNPIASPSSTTTYTVQAISNTGCIAKDSIQVIVSPGPGPGFELPNAFTPDGDGLNDCFGVRSWGAVTELKLTVYNRWGEVVFRTSDPSKCWDGTLKGKKLATAVFVYQVTASTICGKVNLSGTVTLIR